MRVVIGSFSGTVYRGEASESFWRDRPTYAFVPDEADEPWVPDVYADLNWPTLNALANPLTLGSEIWPNMNCPASPADMAGEGAQSFLDYIRNRLALAQAPEAPALS
jgi:hypothetical protein